MSITGQTELRLQNLKPDTVILQSKMKSAQLVVDELVTPCIIRQIVRGNTDKLSGEVTTISLTIFPRIRHTDHTKAGFVDVQITTPLVQFYVYIHIDNLYGFLGTLVKSMAHTSLSKSNL